MHTIVVPQPNLDLEELRPRHTKLRVEGVSTIADALKYSIEGEQVRPCWCLLHPQELKQLPHRSWCMDLTLRFMRACRLAAAADLPDASPQVPGRGPSARLLRRGHGVREGGGLRGTRHGAGERWLS